MRNIMDNIENAAAKLQNMSEKAVDNAKEAFDKVGGNIERAMDEAKEALERALDNLTDADVSDQTEAVEKPLTFGEKLEQEVDSQVNAIRAAQQTPGVFSDYISKKYGKEK